MDFVVKKQNHVLEKQKMMQIREVGIGIRIPDAGIGTRGIELDFAVCLRFRLKRMDRGLWEMQRDGSGNTSGLTGGLRSGTAGKIARVAVVSMDVAHRRTAGGAACAQKEQPKRKNPPSNDGKDVTDDTLNRRTHRPDHTDTLAIRALPDT
ncbi:hypothetical protein QFC20_006208 [Naganishia adeliensis]|uniref:Uncharacterized protein n=1 Tax=Naganishia adeliensis TaxID=92952 RepID=A0ACC2VDZ6_9TREE|nr:hypothetical protein QFC20_006208 [Naganishia adeliensis]